MIFRRLLVFLLAASALILGRHHTAGQSLDPNFGTGGTIVGVPFPGYFPNGGAKLVSTGSGQFVLAVSVNNLVPGNADVGLVRFFGDGSVDTTFGSNGYSVVDWNPAAPDWASGGLAVDGTARVVVAGYSGNPGASADAALAVVNAAGNPDLAFASAGKLILSDSNALSLPSAIVVEANGNIVFDLNAAAVCCSPDSSNLLRYLPDGTSDGAFSAAAAGETSALAIDPFGRIVWVDAVTTGSSVELTIRRLLASGETDPLFNGGVPLTQSLSTSMYPGIGVRRVVIQSSGDIVIAGGPSFSFHAWRYSADGMLDSDFGLGGHFSQLIPNSMLVTALTDHEDRILLVGHADTGVSVDFIVIRLTPDGVLDSAFNGTGIYTLDVALGSDDIARDAILMPDGDLVIAGEINGAVAVGLVRIDLGDPVSLLDNGGFEVSSGTEATKSDGWKGRDLNKDKRRCVPDIVVHSGSCAFVFKGSALESAVISQVVKPGASLLRAGTVLTLRAWASSTATPVLGKVTVFYRDGTRDAFVLSIGYLPTFEQFVSAPFVVAKDAKKFKVSLKNSALAGTLVLDDVALIPNALRVRSLPAPPRSHPPEFRSSRG